METGKNKILLNHRKFAEIIKASGLTQEEFAEEIGISDRYVRSLKTQNKDISVSLAYNISSKFGCSIESMLTIKNAEAEKINNAFLRWRQQTCQNMELVHLLKNNLQNISGLLAIIAVKCEQHNIILKNMTPVRQELTEAITLLNEYLQNIPARTNFCRCSLNQLISEVVKHKQAQFMAAQIKLQTELAADLPSVYLDRQSIRQVLLNCLNNSQAAILAKEQHEGQIIISTRLSANTNMIQILLQDNGIGLTPEQQANFFKPYYTTKTYGNGLGTTICQAIVKLHGGNISVSGKPQAGCCVRIELPVKSSRTFSYDDIYTELADMLF